MAPVFIFGTGRCGSTHLQRLISLSTDRWVWGEHGGFLEPLLDAVRCYETSRQLEQFVFCHSPRSEDRLVADMAAGCEMLSWLNQLKRDELRAEVAALVDRIFRSRLPAGWIEWGFKEIRYGLDNDTPALLLSLFPDATAAFTFRNPRATIESMVRTWTPELLTDVPRETELRRAYAICAQRWKTIVRYFLTREFEPRKKVVFVSADNLRRPASETLRAIALEPTRRITGDLGITNPGPNALPKWAGKAFDELFEDEKTACLALFAQACARGDADFSVLGNH